MMIVMNQPPETEYRCGARKAPAGAFATGKIMVLGSFRTLPGLRRCAQLSGLLLLAAGLSACPKSSSTGVTPVTPPAGPTTYYLDCSAVANGSGTQASPWNSLATANARTFQPGDELLLNRGTTCNGALDPQGSGSSASPIVVDAYGTGALPVINGGAKLCSWQAWRGNTVREGFASQRLTRQP